MRPRRFVLQQAHDDLDACAVRQTSWAKPCVPGQRAGNRPLKVNMLSTTHQQLDGQMACFGGNVENNNANISRIEEELKGRKTAPAASCPRSTETKAVAKSKRHSQKNAGSWTNCSSSPNDRQRTGTRSAVSGAAGEESSLAADVAGRQADVRGLEESMAQTRSGWSS